MAIEVTPHIEQLLLAKAQAEHLSVSELIAKWIKQDIENEQKQSVNPMIDAVMELEPSENFKNVDAVALQREWRNEWR